MRTPARRRLLLALALAPLAACTSSGSSVYRSHFAAISTVQAPLFGYQVEGAPRTLGVEVEIRAHTILWVPTRTDPPTLEEAVSEALRRGRGNLLVNAVVDHWWWYVPPFYGQEGWRVVGDVVRTHESFDGGRSSSETSLTGEADVPENP